MVTRSSTDSARLAACVGTNLNHDGIILYEAAAAIFMMQALGYPITAAGQAELERRLKAWRAFAAAMDRVVEGTPHEQPA